MDGSESDEIVHLLCMEGDVQTILDGTNSRPHKKRTIKRALDILIGLSLKGYEGKSVGAIYLVGDIEGLRRNTSQMIINPFKGWREINIKDGDQLPTIEAFTQLDGALIVDTRGFVHYAGRMINVKENECDDMSRDFRKRKGKGSGTRWRAARFISLKTKTIALTLSSSGTITAFRSGKEIGRMERRLCSIRSSEIPIHLVNSDK